MSLKQCMYLVVSSKPSFKLMLSGLVFYSTACGAILRGLVEDQQGVGIPRAHVSIRSHEEPVGSESGSQGVANSQPRILLTSRADARGEFRFKSIPPGSYDIAVTVPGFFPWKANDVRVGSDFDRRVIATVQVGPCWGRPKSRVSGTLSVIRRRLFGPPRPRLDHFCM